MLSLFRLLCAPQSKQTASVTLTLASHLSVRQSFLTPLKIVTGRTAVSTAKTDTMNEFHSDAIKKGRSLMEKLDSDDGYQKVLFLVSNLSCSGYTPGELSKLWRIARPVAVAQGIAHRWKRANNFGNSTSSKGRGTLCENFWWCRFSKSKAQCLKTFSQCSYLRALRVRSDDTFSRLYSTTLASCWV